MRDPTQRFGDRVDDYVRFRPDYPAALLDWLGSAQTVADLGAGTGIFTTQLLERGHTVHAVEPNAAMRAAMAPHDRLTLHEGTADATGLPDGSVDLLVAAQAFHWFEPVAAAKEARRILRPEGGVALVFNNRRRDGADMQAYLELLNTHGTDFKKVERHDKIAGRAVAFFGGPFETQVFPHHQDLDREGLRGRLRSCSYLPAEGEAGHEAVMQASDDLFAEHGSKDLFRIRYDTLVLYRRPY